MQMETIENYAKSLLDFKRETARKNVVVGLVVSITKANSKYNHSFKIEMDNGSVYYYNGKTENGVYRLFTVGAKAAFTYYEKFSRGKKYKIIDTVFFVF
jgi:hypothetical protein